MEIIEDMRGGVYSLGPDSMVREGVPSGELLKFVWTSEIYAGVRHDVWVYVPAQYVAGVPACVMVFQDGWAYADPAGDVRATVVFDNLIAAGEMPVTIGVFVNPGAESDEFLADPRSHFEKYPEAQRAAEYDVVDGTYARFLLEEVLAEVGRMYDLREDAAGRAICGASSGGLCAWNAAWHRPDAFGRVLSHVGSFADIRGGHVHPFLIRKAERKPIRVFLQGGTNDLDCVWGDWRLVNESMASALAFRGYEYRFVLGDDGHSYKHGGAIFPDSLRWLWGDGE